MKRSKQSFYYILSALLMGGTAILTGCEDGNSAFNPNRIQEEAKKAFPVKDVDPNQTWETTTVCNASISVNEKAGETYALKIYSSNPYNTEGNAQLLTKATVKGGETAELKFDIPTALPFVYVMKVNSEGYSSAIPVTVENGRAQVTFGGTSADTRVAEVDSRSASFFIPEVPGESMFPTTAPADCKDMGNYNQQGNYLLKDATFSSFAPWEGGSFYIQGQVTIKAWSEPRGVTHFYLLPNATLTLEMGQFNHRFNSVFSIGKGAKLMATNTTLQEESGSQLFNRGSIEAQSLIVNSAYLYNAGTIKTEAVTLINQDAKWCNATGGKLMTSTLTSQSNGHFVNETEGVVENSGATTLGTGGSWENAGKYTTASMSITSNIKDVKNGCWLTVNGKLDIADGTIFNESYIGCGELSMNNGTVNMATKSLFEVKGEATFAYNTQGFIASANGEKAVLKIKKATRANGNSNIKYSGQLFVACSDHFAKEENQWNVWYKLENGAELSGTDNANISIPASACCPGYNSTPDGGGNDEIQTYAYAFEDMTTGVGDYDFNDVVLYVSTPIDGKIKVSLMAAGAAKELKVLFKNRGNVQTIFADVHEALGVAAGTITNTGRATGNVATKEIEVGSDFSLTKDGDFFISENNKEVHIPLFTNGFKPGDVPYAICIAYTGWNWPKENIKITEAYSAFSKWAQDTTQETKWYTEPQADKVIQ